MTTIDAETLRQCAGQLERSRERSLWEPWLHVEQALHAAAAALDRLAKLEAAARAFRVAQDALEEARPMFTAEQLQATRDAYEALRAAIAPSPHIPDPEEDALDDAPAAKTPSDVRRHMAEHGPLETGVLATSEPVSRQVSPDPDIVDPGYWDRLGKAMNRWPLCPEEPPEIEPAAKQAECTCHMGPVYRTVDPECPKHGSGGEAKR